MTYKTFLKPNAKKITFFIILFSIIFLVPYIKTDVSNANAAILPPGHYPLILLFIFSLAVFLELLSGIFSWLDFFFFLAFVIFFFLVYIFSCILAYLYEKYILFKQKNVKDEDMIDNNNLILNIKDK